jgi:hypothetical protein
MTHEQPATQQTPSAAAAEAQDALAYEQLDERERWPEEQTEQEEPAEPELPRRPRRKLLRAGENPIPLTLLSVLLIACGFIGGVLVEKGQSSSSNSASAGGLASRFAALRSGGAGFARGAGGGASSAGAFAGGAVAAGGARATIGQVAYLSGHTLYVTDSEGNTVKVKTSVASTVSKTVKSDVKSIHPGETVIVTGATGANGTVSAETIRVSEAGANGGLGALFGAGRPGGSVSRGAGGLGGGVSGGASGSASGGSGEPALFGK